MDTSKKMRLLALGLVIGLGSWWAGARWGQRGPTEVEAVPAVLPQGSAPLLAQDEATNVRIYKQSSPGVANVVTKAVQYDFFLNPVPVEGAGSGFVIDDQGHVLTNYHVIQGAQTVEVTLGDEKRSRFTAHVVGGDVRNDVALLKIDPKGLKLTTLPLGDSGQLQVGQRVLAIGNPFGRFQSTLTTGVVSALGRTVQTGENTLIDEAIQTDAAINQGNSGGPLLNSSGQVIGINTAIFTPTGTTAGIGFAIPINTAKQIAQDLIRDGRVHRAILGIEGPLELNGDWAAALELPVSEGILVQRVSPGGPAERAGIRGGSRAVMVGFYRIYIGGDVIVAIDGKKITEQIDLNVTLNRKRPGESVRVTIYRGRQKMDIEVKLADAGSRGA